MITNEIKQQLARADQSLYGARNFNQSLAMLYHENSKMDQFRIRQLAETILTFSSPYIIERSSQPFKYYAGHKQVPLKDFEEAGEPEGLAALLKSRRSIRDYEPGYKLSLYELYTLLHYSYGIMAWEKLNTGNGHFGYRPTPSAGGLYPLELYIAVFSGHMPEGIYHYQARENSLELVTPGNFMEQCSATLQTAPYINLKDAAGVIFITGIPERVMIKYGERGYRFLLQEAGFVGQNISLLCEESGLGCCFVGACLDNRVEEMLGIDGVFESLQSVLVIGKKKQL